MGLINNKTLKLFVIFAVMFLIPIQLTQSANLVNTLNSYPATKPVIDGTL